MANLRIYIKQQERYNISGQPVVYTGTNPLNLTAQTIPLPNNRRWPNHGSSEDVTDYVSNLQKLQLTWTADKDSYGQSVPGEYQNKKSASGTLIFEGEAYQLIKQWLIDDVSAPLNAVQVSIHDTGCNQWYNDYSFNAADLQFCEGTTCEFSLTLRQKEEPIDCIRRTVISDNWQGWFSEVSPKQHPRFSYCNEQRPNGILIMLWWFVGTMFAQILPLIFIIAGLINSILFVINLIINIIQFLGGAPDPFKDDIKYIDPKDFMDSFGQYFVETGGCGREHPAPLIRDYIKNVCDKCGVEVDGVTAPIFFAEYFDIETSGRGVITTQNHHYNACLLTPISKRGIRRFKTLGIVGQSPNTANWYIPENKPLYALDQFLDLLKPLYNFEWNLRGGKLYIQRKDFYTQNNYIFDFSQNASDRLKLLEGICFEWNEIKLPAYCNGLYTEDGADRPGNEAKDYYNDIINFAQTDVNPNFEGQLDKTTRFSPIKFRLDGASEDYLYDAMQVVVNGSFLTPFLAGLMFDFVGSYFQKYSDYGILLQGETCTTPKVVIWDGQSYDNAKAVKPFAAHDNTAATGQTTPNINAPYNGNAHRWQDRHAVETFVRGSGLTLPPNQPGYYLVTDFFGAREIKQPAMLCNYFMYMAQDFEDSMWDWFHWIDDPRRKPKMNQNWSCKIDLCCEDLARLKVNNSGEDAVLNQLVKLPVKYYPDGRIKEITVSYDVENDRGAYIELKGTV